MPEYLIICLYVESAIWLYFDCHIEHFLRVSTGQVIAQIRTMEAQLRATGQKACVIIATDGESSDGDIANAMRPLQALPVWVVVRLCTGK